MGFAALVTGTFLCDRCGVKIKEGDRIIYSMIDVALYENEAGDLEIGMDSKGEIAYHMDCDDKDGAMHRAEEMEHSERFGL